VVYRLNKPRDCVWGNFSALYTSLSSSAYKARIDHRQRLDKNPASLLGDFALKALGRHCPHQPVQLDRLGCYRRITFVGDCFPIDEGEVAQRSNRLVQSLALKLRRQRLAELLARLGEKEQWNCHGREQRRIRDQWLGGGM
jgi:hypothetical protein